MLLFCFDRCWVRTSLIHLHGMKSTWSGHLEDLHAPKRWSLCKQVAASRRSWMNAIQSRLTKHILLFLVGGLLQLTLTSVTSSDSIWALFAALFLLNIVLTDYESTRTPGVTRERSVLRNFYFWSFRSYVDNSCHDRLTSVLSINATISSSVVLVSRLPDDISILALVLFSVQAFALFPILRSKRIQ